MALSIDQFINEISASGIIPAADLFSWMSSIAEADRPKTSEELARQLVKQKKLTKFQAEQIYAGQGRSLTLGNYLILDKLGQGGMGVVLKAMHRRMERIVALKVMSQAGMKSPDAVQRFHREVKAVAKLHHPNIVAAFDADESNGTHFLVMEYVDGTDLSAFVKKHGPMPMDQAVQCILQAARGLEFAHSQGVIHRDIKPSNLLLARSDRIPAVGTGPDESGHYERDIIKILDMGLARIEGAESAQGEITTTGAVLGTVDYMAPEQALSAKSADARSDIYSLGITLWYLLTGRVAYDGDSLMAKLLAHRDAPVPSLVDVVATSLLASATTGTQTIDHIFHKMVAKQPRDRYQSMTEVIRDLERCLAGTAAIVLTQPTGSDHRSDTSPIGATADSVKTANVFSAAEAETVVLPGSKQKAETHAELSRTVDGTHPPSSASSGRTDRTRLALFGSIAAALIAIGAFVWSRSGQPDQQLKPGNSSTANTGISEPNNGDSNARHILSDKPSAPDFALEFDFLRHPSTRVSIPLPSLDPNLPWTLEGYIQPADIPDHNEGLPAIFEGDPWQLILSHWTLRLVEQSGPLSEQPKRTPNMIAQKLAEKWRGKRVHLAGVFDGKQAALFVDGQLIGKAPPKFIPKQHRGKLFLGARFSGRMDEWRISKVARYDDDFTPPARYESDADTVALFHFDDGDGDRLRDSSGNNHHGEITDATWVKSEAVESSEPVSPNYALQFSKHGHRVELPALKLKLEDTHTIEAFVTPASDVVPGTTWGHFINLSDQLALQMHAENLASFHVRLAQPGSRGSLFSAGMKSLLRDRRTHVAGVQTTGEIRFFVDGKLVNVTKIEGRQFAEEPRPALIGGGAGSMGFFDGVIDEVRISNTARYEKDFTPETRFKADDKTLALYHCDEGNGIDLKDSSGNGNHGKIFGAQWIALDGNRPSSEAATRNYALEFAGGENQVVIDGISVPDAGAFTWEGRVTLKNAGDMSLMSLPTANGQGLFRVSIWKNGPAAVRVGAQRSAIGKTSSQTLPDSRAFHMAVVQSADTWTIWVDGTKVGQGSDRYGWGNPVQTLFPAKMGVESGVPIDEQQRRVPFEGTLDEVRISRFARYNTDFKPQTRLEPDKDTIALYHFDEGEGDVLKDSSGNNHHGKIIGPKWVKVNDATSNEQSVAPVANATPFVILRNGTEAARHATLEEAFNSIQSQDVIEVHGNGPFPIGGPKAIRVGKKESTLTLKAASGFRPLFVAAPSATESTSFLFNVDCGIARFEDIDFVSSEPGLFEFKFGRDVSFLRCCCLATSKRPGRLMFFHGDQEPRIRFNECLLASAKREGGLFFLGSPAKIEMTNTFIHSNHSPMILEGGGHHVQLDRCTFIGGSPTIWNPPKTKLERATPGTAELSRCLAFGSPRIGDHVRWKGQDNVYGVSEFGESGVLFPEYVNVPFDEWVNSPTKPETGSKQVSTKAKLLDEFLDPNPAVTFSKLKTYLDELRTLHPNVGADPAVADSHATPFVTFRSGVEAARHATLEEALSAMQSQDVIEVRSNGPFSIGGPKPINVGVRSDNVFTLRGASGFRPLFVSAPDAQSFDIHCDTARFEDIDFALAGPGGFHFYGVRDVAFQRCRCVSPSNSEGWLMSFHSGEDQIVRFSDCFVASARREGVLGFRLSPAKVELSNTCLMTQGNPLTLLSFGSTVRLNRCTVIGSSSMVWHTPTNEKERSLPGNAELTRCLVFGVPYIGDHVRWQGKDNVYGVSELGASGVYFPGDVILSFDEWVKSPAKPETGSKQVSTKAKRFDGLVDRNPAVMFGKMKTYLDELRTMHPDVGADPAVADGQSRPRSTEAGNEGPWTDWLGPKLKRGDFIGNRDGWIVEGDSITTDRVIQGLEVLPPGTRDAAVRVTYLLRASGGLQLTARERKTGEIRDFHYFANDNGKTIQFAALGKGDDYKRLAENEVPSEISKDKPRTLEFRLVGDTLTLTLNGTVAITAKDSSQSEGLFTFAALKGLLIQKIEIKNLDSQSTNDEPDRKSVPSAPPPAVASGTLFMNDPAFAGWVKGVQAMPPEQQIEAVMKKLMEINPGFNGKTKSWSGITVPQIEAGVVTAIGFNTNYVRDISPVSALTGLKKLVCVGGGGGNHGKLVDLSPIQRLKLTSLLIGSNEIADLTPLREMKLTQLDFTANPISDLSLLKGMPLEKLSFGRTGVSSLEPIKGKKLTFLYCAETPISDLSLLLDCKTLRTLQIKGTKVTPASVAALTKAIPDCDIEWDDPSADEK